MAEPESGLHKAGWILVLVGAIMNFVAAFLVAFAGIALIATGEITGEESPVPTIMGIVYFITSLVSIAGGIVGITAYRSAKAGDVHGAWIRGLVSSLLPPVQALTLVGAILLLVSPEHEAWQARQA